MATIEKKGSGRWRARIRRVEAPDLSRTFPTMIEAKRWARQVESDLDRGVHADASAHVSLPGSEVSSPDGSTPSRETTLGELIALYLDTVTPGHRGAKVEHSRITRWLRDPRHGGHPLRDHHLSSISRQQVQAWITNRLKTVKPDTVRRDVGLLQQIVAYAMRDWGYDDLPANPFQQARKPRSAKGRVRRLGDEEERYLRLALDPDAKLPDGIRPTRSAWLLHVFTFAIETAMRRGELIKVRWENVDLNTSVVDLPDSDTKNGERRSVPLSERAVSALLAMGRKRSGAVFGDATRDTVSRIWRRTLKRARRVYEADCKGAGEAPDPGMLSDLRWHDLRHEGTSRLFEYRFEFTEVATVTRHKDVRMLMRYTHHRAASLAARMRAQSEDPD